MKLEFCACLLQLLVLLFQLRLQNLINPSVLYAHACAQMIISYLMYLLHLLDRLFQNQLPVLVSASTDAILNSQHTVIWRSMHGLGPRVCPLSKPPVDQCSLHMTPSYRGRQSHGRSHSRLQPSVFFCPIS